MTLQKATKDFVISTICKQVRDKDGIIHLEVVYNYQSIPSNATGRVMVDTHSGEPILTFVLDGVKVK